MFILRRAMRHLASLGVDFQLGLQFANRGGIFLWGSMTEIERLKHLKLALRIVGVIAIFGFYPLTVFWPSGWAWSSGRSEYLEMIIAIYAALGIFLIIAARSPRQHLGLVSFAIWSSIVHGAVMAVQATLNTMHVHH